MNEKFAQERAAITAALIARIPTSHEVTEEVIAGLLQMADASIQKALAEPGLFRRSPRPRQSSS